MKPVNTAASLVENVVRVWVEKLSMGTDNGAHFPVVGQRFADRGHVRGGKVGNADALFCSTRALVDFAAGYFRESSHPPEAVLKRTADR